MSERELILPVGGTGTRGSFVIVGSDENVKAMMAKLNAFVRNELYVQATEAPIPQTARPAPCSGCGN